MADDRWNDPSKIPLSNGPFRITTPPEEPQFKLQGHQQVVEFVLPFPMHIIDPNNWNPLTCTIAGRKVWIDKPIPVFTPFQPEGRLGNISPDTFCSIIRVCCAEDKVNLNYPSTAECWALVERLCRWIRVKARHYWLLHGQSGFSAIFHASVLTQAGSTMSQKNAVTYGRNLIVLPLYQSLWSSIQAELQNGTEPPVSASLYCDALVSAFGGDEIKALLELGVAAEVEITQMLIEVANAPTSTPSKKKFIQQVQHKPQSFKFYAKLCDWPKKLGLLEAQKFTHPKLFSGWIDVAQELYRFRGSVAHSGALKTGVSAKHLSHYIYAVNALFLYCREQKAMVGLKHYSYPSGNSPYEQMVLFRDGLFYSETNKVTRRAPIG